MYFLITLTNPARDVVFADIGWLCDRLDATRRLLLTNEPRSRVEQAFSHFAEVVDVREITGGQHEQMSRRELCYWAPRLGPMGAIA